MKKQNKLSYNQLIGRSAELAVLLWPGIMTVVFLISMIVAVAPKIDEINQINLKRLDVEAKTKQNNEKRGYLLSIDQAEMQKNATLLEGSIIREKDSYFMVNVMRNIFDRFSYQIDSFLISPGEIKLDATKETKSNPVKKIPITVTVTGPKSRYVELLTEVEHSLPIISLDKMEMTSTFDQVKMKLVVSAYYLASLSEINVNNLSLADLTLKKEEQDLFSKLATFRQVVLGQNTDGTGEFVKYQRSDPFSF